MYGSEYSLHTPHSHTAKSLRLVETPIARLISPCSFDGMIEEEDYFDAKIKFIE